MAWSKMVGFEVRPVTDKDSIYFFNVPLVRRSRVMLSSQRLWPRSYSTLVALIVSSPSGGHECSQSVIGQIAEMVQLNVGWLTASESLRVPRVVTLSYENRGDALTPHLLNSVED